MKYPFNSIIKSIEKELGHLQNMEVENERKIHQLHKEKQAIHNAKYSVSDQKQKTLRCYLSLNPEDQTEEMPAIVARYCNTVLHVQSLSDKIRKILETITAYENELNLIRSQKNQIYTALRKIKIHKEQFQLKEIEKRKKQNTKSEAEIIDCLSRRITCNED